MIAVAVTAVAVVFAALGGAWVRWRQSAEALTANRKARPGLWADWRRGGLRVAGRVLLAGFVVVVVLGMVYMASTPEQH